MEATEHWEKRRKLLTQERGAYNFVLSAHMQHKSNIGSLRFGIIFLPYFAIIWDLRPLPLNFFTLTRQKTLTRQIGNGNEVAGVKVGKFHERVHNFASTDQMEATNSAK